MNKQIAVVTGASSGLGMEFVRQIALKYPGLEEIWMIARRKERLEELSAAGRGKPELKPVPLDVTYACDLHRLTGLLETEKPCIRLLVNCAGYGKAGPFELDSFENQIGMIDVNCRGLTAVTYLALPYIRKNSRILQVASAAAFIPQKDFAVYAATKAYVNHFSMALAKELKGRQISVTSVCPGPVDTEFFQIADPQNQRKFYKNWVMAQPGLVVKKALLDASRGKQQSIYGLPIKAVKLASHFI